MHAILLTVLCFALWFLCIFLFTRDYSFEKTDWSIWIIIILPILLTFWHYHEYTMGIGNIQWPQNTKTPTVTLGSVAYPDLYIYIGEYILLKYNMWIHVYTLGRLSHSVYNHCWLGWPTIPHIRTHLHGGMEDSGTFTFLLTFGNNPIDT